MNKRPHGIVDDVEMRSSKQVRSPYKEVKKPGEKDEDNAFIVEQKRLFYDRMEALNNTYEQYWNDPNLKLHKELIHAEYRRHSERFANNYQPKSGKVMLCGSQDCSQLGTACHIGDSLKKFKGLKNIIKSEIVHVEAGALTSFFTTRDGKLFSFGTSDLGALGRKTDLNIDETVELRAVQVMGFNPSQRARVRVMASNEDSSIMQVAAGVSHCLVLSNRGAVYQFGCFADSENSLWREMPPPDFPDTDNVNTELYKGAAPRGFREGPRHLYMMPQSVRKVYAGGAMSAVLLKDNTILTWGVDERGELGQDNSPSKREVFKTIKRASGNVRDEDISEEERKNYKSTIDRCLKQIKEEFLTPRKVVYDPPLDNHDVVDVAFGASHMLVVVRRKNSVESLVYGAGLNQYGQLGLGHQDDAQKLTLIPDSKDKFIIKVAAGLHHSVFLNLFGDMIWTCGRSDYGQLGITDGIPKAGKFENRMQQLAFDNDDDPVDLNFHSISAGDHQSYAVSRSGKLYSWGFNDCGSLGHGNEDDEPRPTPIKKFHKDVTGVVLEAFAGSQHAIVLASTK